MIKSQVVFFAAFSLFSIAISPTLSAPITQYELSAFQTSVPSHQPILVKRMESGNTEHNKTPITVKDQNSDLVFEANFKSSANEEAFTYSEVLMDAIENEKNEILCSLYFSDITSKFWYNGESLSMISYAIKHKKIDLLIKLIEAGAKFTEADKLIAVNEKLLFEEGIRKNDPDLVRALIKAGADILKVEEYYFFGTALHWAADAGYTNIVEILISKKADVNQLAGMSQSLPLHIAARNGHTDIVNKLIKAGAVVDAKDLVVSQGTALIVAVSGNHIETVKALLDAHADPSIRDRSNGMNALHYAAHGGNVDMLNILIESPKVNLNDKSIKLGDTALHMAVKKKRPDMVRALVMAKADLNVRNKLQLTPLELFRLPQYSNNSNPENEKIVNEIISILTL